MERRGNKWDLTDWFILLIALTPTIAAIILYDRLPEQMVAHYDKNYQPDRYQDKLSLLLTFSIFSLLPVFLKYVSRFDPRKENYQKFSRAYTITRFGVTLLLSGAYGLALLDALGYKDQINLHWITFMGLGLFFLILGNYLGQIRFSYLTGIRSPWTMANQDVWRKTHRLAAPLWMIAGLILIISAFLPGVPALLVLGLVIALTLVIPFVASYFYYRKL